MSDSPASAFPQIAPRDDSSDVIGREELESALDDFRLWFMETAELPSGLVPSERPPTIDLATLLGHFVALRQEINLQTRAVRAQQEQTSDVVGKFQQSLDLAQRSHSRAEQIDRQGQEERLRPLLNTLADLYDSLSTAAAQIQRVTTGILPQLDEMVEEIDDDFPPEEPRSHGTQARSFWSRWILSPTADDSLRSNEEQTRNAQSRLRREHEERQRRAEVSAKARDQVEEALSALLSGYTMNLERIERSLRKHNLEAIQAVGATFDPESMEVLEGVHGTGCPNGEVVEEVQRGYLLNGRVFRSARVRVARN